MTERHLSSPDLLDAALAAIDEHLAVARDWPGASGVVPGLELARSVLLGIGGTR